MLHHYDKYKHLDHVLTVCSHCRCAGSSITKLTLYQNSSEFG